MVSVLMVTYRHEAFVAAAVHSVLAQTIGCPVEVLISEDCSPDRTRQIVLDLQRRHPETVRVFLSEQNQNDNEVLARAWRAARGRYIAMLDGDDYWTDTLKLRKQIDVLERHPDVFVCGHAVTIVDEHGRERPARQNFDMAEGFLTREDLAAGYGAPASSSLVFRNNGRLPPPEIFNAAFNADTFMLAFFANFGAGYVSRDVMGAYREHPGGVWSTLDDRRSADHRNTTLVRIPLVLDRSLRSIAYARLLAHALREDYRWPRRLWQIPYAFVMMLLTMGPRSARYLWRRLVARGGVPR